MGTIRSAEEIRAAIAEREQCVAEICQTMKGPLSNLERTLLRLDRKDMREQIASLRKELAEAGGSR